MATGFSGLLQGLQVPKDTSFNVLPKPNMSTPSGPAVGGVGAPVNVAPPKAPASGVKAKSPTDNIKPQNNVIAPSQTSAKVTPPATPVISSSTSTPNPSGGGSTLYAPGSNIQNTPPNQPGGIPPPPTAPANTPQAPQPQGLFPSLIAGITSTAQGYQPLASQAAQNVAGIQNNIGELRQQSAQAQGAYKTGGLTVPVAQGRAQAIASTEAQQEQGLGIQQQAQQGLFNNLISAQSAQQSGLTSAAGLTQPSTAAFGQTVFNPATGQYDNGGGLPQNVLQQYAQMAANGQYSAIPSTITSNPVLSAQLNEAAKQINPNFNPIASQAQGAATASNIQTQGTTQTDIGAQGLGQATQAYTGAYTVNNTAEGQIKVLQNILNTTGINSSNSADYNKAINNLQGRLGSTGYAQFVTGLSELRNAYSQLLSTGGGTPSGNEQIALNTLNENNSAQQIQASIQTLQQNAYAKLNSLYGNVQTYQNILGGQGNSGGAPASGGSTGSGAIDWDNI